MNKKLHIAVNTRLLIPNQMDGIGRYTEEVLKIMVKENPDVDFTFIFDRPFSQDFIFAKNVTGVNISPPTRHSILMWIYFEWSLPRLLKRIKPDVFFSPDGWLSLKAQIPQVNVIHDLNFEHFPQFVPLQWSLYYRYFFPKFARKAKHIISVSEYSAQDIASTYLISPEKISIAPNAAFQGSTSIDEESVPPLPYFLFVSTLHPRKNIANIIRAYNLYRAQSSEKKLLLFAGKKMWWNSEMEQELEKSPFKTDIIFTGRISDEALNGLYKNAFSLLYPSLFEGFGLPIVEALKWNLPVITAQNSSLPEVGGNAALYCDAQSPTSICEAMIKIENEEIRNALKSEAQAQLNKFSWEFSARKIMEVLKSVIQSSKS